MTKMLAIALSTLFLSANVHAADRSHHTDHSSSRCARQYKVNVGDTCDKISADQTTSTYQLASLNPKINSACSNLIIGGMLCLGLKNRDCTTIQVVQQGDICSKIAAKAGITLSDLLTNNPNVNQGCTNIYPGEVLCVAPATGSASSTPSTSDDLSGSSSPPLQGGYTSSSTPFIIPSTSDDSPSQGDIPSFPAAALMNLTLPADINSTINGIPPIKLDAGSSQFNTTLPLGMNSTISTSLIPTATGNNSTAAGSSSSSSTAPNPSPN